MQNSSPDIPPEFFAGLAGLSLVMVLVTLAFFAVYLTLLIWSLVWVARDAEARGKSGALLALLIFFTWPIGLVVWVVARPELRRVPPLPWPNPPPLPP